MSLLPRMRRYCVPKNGADSKCSKEVLQLWKNDRVSTRNISCIYTIKCYSGKKFHSGKGKCPTYPSTLCSEAPSCAQPFSSVMAIGTRLKWRSSVGVPRWKLRPNRVLGSPNTNSKKCTSGQRPGPSFAVLLTTSEHMCIYFYTCFLQTLATLDRHPSHTKDHGGPCLCLGLVQKPS